MTEAEMIALVQSLIGDDMAASVTTDVISVYLDLAAQKMLVRIYPFDATQTDIPTVYQTTQCELASRLILRRGAEGETAHNENGINRTYGSVDDEDILSRLTPYAKVM